MRALSRFLAAALTAALTLVSAPAFAEGSGSPTNTTGVLMGRAGGSAAPILIASINTTFPAAASDSGCWSAQWPTDNPTIPNPDGGSPLQQAGLRGGYTTSGAVTSYAYNWTFTARVRLVYPSQASLTLRTVALSEYVHPTDTIGAVDTSGCDRAPTPVANWATPHRQAVGNTMPAMEVLAFSRDAQNGAEVAAVSCSVTDGTTTLTGLATGPAISARPDANPVIDYTCPAFNITTLNAGLITENAKVFPWYGGPASVADSSAVTPSVANLRRFSPRYFWKDTGAPLVAYLCPQSNCTGGGTASGSCVASTTAATAQASPCTTGTALANALKAAGAVDNATVFVGSNAGTPPFMDYPASGGLTQHGGCLTFTRDPLTTRANAQIGFGNSSGPAILTVTNPTSTACVRLFDLTAVRAAGNTIDNTISLETVWDQITLNDATFTGTWFRNTDVDYLYDVAITNPGGNFLAAAAGGNHAILRGLNIPSNNGNVENTTIVGTTLVNPSNLFDANGQTSDGAIDAFDKFLQIANSGFGGPATAVPNGAAYVQSVYEFTSATPGTVLPASNDGATYSTNNIILQYNTVAGAYIAGRSNLFYDEGTTERVNKLQSCRGNFLTQINTKGDVVVTDGTRVGNWGFLYGVGCSGQETQYLSSNGATDDQIYSGLGALPGSSSTTAQMPVTKFTNYQAVTCVTPGSSCATFVAGSGGGTYTLTTGALVKGIVPKAALPFDLAGTARPTTADTAGAYVAP